MVGYGGDTERVYLLLTETPDLPYRHSAFLARKIRSTGIGRTPRFSWRAARNHRLLITDKTPANVLALARLVLDPAEPGTADVLTAMETMCRAWMPRAYDLVVYCRDRFDQQAGGDQFRRKVLGLQNDADTAVYEACKASGVALAELPTGLPTADRVRWITDRVNRLGLAHG